MSFDFPAGTRERDLNPEHESDRRECRICERDYRVAWPDSTERLCEKCREIENGEREEL